MVDTATARFGARKQSLGSNVNTWGDTKLNEVIDLLDRGAKGYQAIAMTGDVTLNWTSYLASNQGQVQTVKLTGLLDAPANLIVPSREWSFTVINTTGQTVTVKTFAGTGVAIPTGYQAAVYCDAANVGSAGPTLLTGAVQVNGKVSGVAAATEGTDAVNKTQMDTAIALATTSTSPGTLRVSALDTTAKFLNSAVTVTVGTLVSLQAATLNPGADEQLSLTAAPTTLFLARLGLNMTDTSVSLTATPNTFYRATAQCTINLGTLTTNQVIGIARDTAAAAITVGRSSQTIDGIAADFVIDENKYIILFLCTGTGTIVTRKIGDLPT